MGTNIIELAKFLNNFAGIHCVFIWEKDFLAVLVVYWRLEVNSKENHFVNKLISYVFYTVLNMVGMVVHSDCHLSPSCL